MNTETSIVHNWLAENDLAAKFMETYNGKVPFRSFINYLFQYEIDSSIEVNGICLLSDKLNYRELNRTMYNFLEYNDYEPIAE